MRTSVDLVNGNTSTVRKRVLRKNLQVGDLFIAGNSGKVYMHTGCRSCPPTQRSVTIHVGDQSIEHEIYAAQGSLPNGKDIIGWQSMIVEGDPEAGGDGTSFTTKGNREVTYVGKGHLTLEMID